MSICTDLHGILDFSDIPDSIRKLVQNFQVHVVEVRNDPGYQQMEKDAYDLAAFYTKTEGLVEKKNYYREMLKKYSI